MADGTALALLVAHGTTRPVTLVAGLLHLVGLLPCLLSRTLASSEKAMGAAFVFALPVAGVAEPTQAHLHGDEVRRIGGQFLLILDHHGVGADDRFVGLRIAGRIGQGLPRHLRGAGGVAQIEQRLRQRSAIGDCEARRHGHFA